MSIDLELKFGQGKQSKFERQLAASQLENTTSILFLDKASDIMQNLNGNESFSIIIVIPATQLIISTDWIQTNKQTNIFKTKITRFTL